MKCYREFQSSYIFIRIYMFTYFVNPEDESKPPEFVNFVVRGQLDDTNVKYIVSDHTRFLYLFVALRHPEVGKLYYLIVFY